MSAFRDLLQQAHTKGAAEIGFYCNPEAFFANDQALSWKCWAAGPDLDPDEERREAWGRTGEEALRHLVERL